MIRGKMQQNGDIMAKVYHRHPIRSNEDIGLNFSPPYMPLSDSIH